MIRGFDVRAVEGLALMFTATTDDGIAVRFTPAAVSPEQMQAVFDAMMGGSVPIAADVPNDEGGPAAEAAAPAEAEAAPAVVDAKRVRADYLSLCKREGIDLGKDRTAAVRAITRIVGPDELKALDPTEFTAMQWHAAGTALRCYLNQASHVLLPGEKAQDRPGMARWVDYCMDTGIELAQGGLHRTARETAEVVGYERGKSIDTQCWRCEEWDALTEAMRAYRAADPAALLPYEDPFANE